MTYFDFITRIVIPIALAIAGYVSRGYYDKSKAITEAALRRTQIRKQFLLNLNILKSAHMELSKLNGTFYDAAKPIDTFFCLNLTLLGPLLAFGPVTYGNNDIEFEAFDMLRQQLYAMERKFSTLQNDLAENTHYYHPGLIKDLDTLIKQVESLLL